MLVFHSGRYVFALSATLFLTLIFTSPVKSNDVSLLLSCKSTGNISDLLDNVDLIVVNFSKNIIQMYASKTDDEWSFDERRLYKNELNNNRVIINSDPNSSFRAAGFRDGVPYFFRYDADTELLTYSNLYGPKPRFFTFRCSR